MYCNPTDPACKAADLGLRKDSLVSQADLPTTAGSPCKTDKCGSNLYCHLKVCRMKCSIQSCNDKDSTCKPNEGCVGISSYTSICIPAKTAGESCETEPCAQGALCVDNPQANVPYKCLTLCKYGCTAGTQCVALTNNCRACF
jgi:hypothetical protein